MYQRSISNTCCNKLILIIFFDNFPKFVDGIMTLGWPDWHSSENTSCLQSPINVYFNTTAAFYSRFHGCIPGQPVNVRLFTVQECISPFIDLSKGSQLNEVMTHVLTIHGWDTTSLNTYSGSVICMCCIWSHFTKLCYIVWLMCPLFTLLLMTIKY